MRPVLRCYIACASQPAPRYCEYRHKRVARQTDRVEQYGKAALIRGPGLRRDRGIYARIRQMKPRF